MTHFGMHLLAASLAVGVFFSAGRTQAQTYHVYVGTYTDGISQGIYRLELDTATGKLSEPELVAKAKNPSFLAIHPEGKHLFAVSEVDGAKGGAVIGFALDPKSGALTPINHSSTVGSGPCHLVVDKTGKNVLVANYGGGSSAVIPIGEGGKLGEASCFVQHKGSSVNPGRQKEPHAHSVNLDAANKFAFVADLGLDKVLIYKFDPAAGTITAQEPAGKVTPGSGPRHFAFSKDGKHAYVINEMGNTITAFDYDADKGTLTEIQNISTLPEGFTGTSYTAEVVVHPSGKFVYGSNRGHDSLAVFSADPETGKLTLVDITKTGGKTPRNFAIDPTGKYVLAENQGSDSIVVFAVDPATGKLTPTGQSVKVGAPVCVKFLAK